MTMITAAAATTTMMMMLMMVMTTTVVLLWTSSTVDAFLPQNRSSYFNIQIPTKLHRNHSIEHRPAMFGPHYNLRMEAGSLILPVHILDKKHAKLCKTLTDPEIDAMTWLTPPYILMVERGSCTFVHKVRNAQRLGASAVLVADMAHNFGESGFPKIMANDGSGQDIGIPSMLIDKKFGHELMTVLTESNHSHAVVEMAYHAPKFDYMVSLDLWHNPIDYHTVKFFQDWSVLENVFKDENGKSMLNFHAHALLLDGTSLGCKGQSHKNESSCYDLCTNDGRYCHVPSHDNMIAGKDVVAEILRRQCIHKHYDKQDHDQANGGATFWSYLSHFYKYCMDHNNPTYFANDECISDAFGHSGIDKDVIKDCMKDSGELDGDIDNSELQRALKNQMEAGIIKSPTVMVNHDRAVLWDGLKASNVLYALCESYIEGQKPHVCYACMRCGDPMACAQRDPMHCEATDGQEKEHEHKHHGGDDDNHHHDDDHHSGGKKKKGGHFFKWFFGLVLIGGAAGGFFYYKKHIMENRGTHDGLGSYSLQDAFLSESG